MNARIYIERCTFAGAYIIYIYELTSTWPIHIYYIYTPRTKTFHWKTKDLFKGRRCALAQRSICAQLSRARPSAPGRSRRPLRAIRSHPALPSDPADDPGRLRSVLLQESACSQLVSSSLHVAAAYAEVIRVGALRPL